MGWLEAGPVLLRLDIAERVAAELAWATRRGADRDAGGLASRFSLKAELLPVVLRRLGFRVVPAGGLAAGRISARRRRPCCCRSGAGGRPSKRPRQVRGARTVRGTGGAEALAERRCRNRKTATGSGWTSGCGARASCGRATRLRRAGGPRARIRINRQPTDKAHARLRVGDVLTVPVHGSVRVVRVLALAARRGPATEARLLYQEIRRSRRLAEPCDWRAISSAYRRL